MHTHPFNDPFTWSSLVYVNDAPPPTWSSLVYAHPPI